MSLGVGTRQKKTLLVLAGACGFPMIFLPHDGTSAYKKTVRTKSLNVSHAFVAQVNLD